MKRLFTMTHKNEGLTVGELTIAIAALIVMGLIWSTFSNNEGRKDGSTQNRTTNPQLIYKL